MTHPVPIVLVGGRSTRFGRDKLREPLHDGWLVDRPIAALREATGLRVTLVGACDPEVAARGDDTLADAHPDQGPAGGILTALERFATDVLVLPGDVPQIRAENVRALIEVAAGALHVRVVRARGRAPEPCIAIYRRSATQTLAERLRAGERALFDAFQPSDVVEVAMAEADIVNANTVRALQDAAMSSARTEGVWDFEEIDAALDLVPIAARRALDRTGIHLSLEGWRTLPRERRHALVLAGAADLVDTALVRSIAAGSAVGYGARTAVGADDDPAPQQVLPADIGARLAVRWTHLRPVERFAILHAARSAARRGDPARVVRVVLGLLGDERL